jgi:hypothetical protein
MKASVGFDRSEELVHHLNAQFDPELHGRTENEGAMSTRVKGMNENKLAAAASYSRRYWRWLGKLAAWQD